MELPLELQNRILLYNIHPIAVMLRPVILWWEIWTKKMLENPHKIKYNARHYMVKSNILVREMIEIFVCDFWYQSLLRARATRLRENQVRKIEAVRKQHAEFMRNNLFHDSKSAFADLWTTYNETILRKKNFVEE